ncbi:MAG: hypothetical protein ACK417_04120 [Bacteroidia bacterium]
MWNSKKLIILLLVFVFTGLGVLLTRWLNDRRLLLSVRVFIHDGELIGGGREKLLREMQSGRYAGIFYEADQQGFLLPFTGQLKASLLDSLMSEAQAPWHVITPDTLFLRAWSISYARMMYKIPVLETDSLNALHDKHEQMRRRAVMAPPTKRLELLERAFGPIDRYTDGHARKLRKRYSRQMLNALSRVALKDTGKEWLLLIDVDHYADMKTAFDNTKRMQWHE